MVIFIKKSFNFLKSYLFKNPRFVFNYGIAYFQKEYVCFAKFYTEDEVLSLIKAGKSYIRLGDGEIALLNGRSIHHQRYDPDFSKKLKQVILNYKKDEDYILAIPERYLNSSNQDLKNRSYKNSNYEANFFRCWLPFKVFFKMIFPKNIKYTDAHSFYVNGFFENKVAPLIKNKKLIIITTLQNINNQKDFLEKEFSVAGWIEAKSPNPFDWLDKYKKEIESIISLEDFKKSNLTNKDFIIIAGAGPASKVLAYDLCKYIQVLDVGHGFEHFYKGKSLDHILQ